ncbi:hypothetical protein ACFXPV_27735 [Streptomyces sp. NPDC059118]|uniref:hypothetical protein n=1 Tax=unclassified Streptomyces TaxID=2593676 RepID=UPI0036CB1C61
MSRAPRERHPGARTGGERVPGTERERAHDVQTAQRLGALVSGKAVTSDDALVRQITGLLRAREEST